MKRIAATIVVAALVVTASALVVIAQQSPATGRERLAQALKGAWLPLESGLIVGSTQGTPLSAKYEIDDGAFQLSVYTVKADASSGDAFMEVIVEYNTGTIARVETITDGGDLAAAREQQMALAVAKRTLETATAAVVKANTGYRAVSVTPAMNNGRPVAEILLLNGTDWKAVSEPLD
jgi:hypothetical protein